MTYQLSKVPKEVKAVAGTLNIDTSIGTVWTPGGIWNSSGKVGIGTTAPGAALDVVGLTQTTTLGITNLASSQYSSATRVIYTCGSWAWCYSGWVINLGAISAGQYLIHWQANIRWYYPMWYSFGQLYFLINGVQYNSPYILAGVYGGTLCGERYQQESGMFVANVTADSTIQVQTGWYGGDNNPIYFCGSGGPQYFILETYGYSPGQSIRVTAIKLK